MLLYFILAREGESRRSASDHGERQRFFRVAQRQRDLRRSDGKRDLLVANSCSPNAAFVRISRQIERQKITARIERESGWCRPSHYHSGLR